MPVVEEREIVRDVAGLAEVEEAIAHSTDALRDPSADVPTLVARLEALRERREALATTAAEPTAVMVETGQTFAGAWAAATFDGRRALLAATLRGSVVLLPGVRGRRGFDAARVDAPWPWLTCE